MSGEHILAPKPHLHITSPFGWLNDPCAPCYNPNTGLYHLFYQCNPNGVEWGDMSWGHATSKDLVKWRFGSRHTKLEPDQDYDISGVFTGCMAPVAPDGTMTIFYTSICHLPFHWTSPAPRGSAGLAMATSTDGGETWNKSDLNPILKAEPDGLDVTGFRDPYLAEWDAMDQIRGSSRTLYGLISGGIQGRGPTTFVYAVNPTKLTTWEYLGPLVDMVERFQPDTKWNCGYGMNWECVNFMTLKNESASRDFLILGSEGDVQRAHLIRREGSLLSAELPKVIRAQQWMVGNLVKGDAGVRMRYDAGGILDHGSYYAANSFLDPKTQRQIVYGWIPEDDCTIHFIRKKGWNGCQALPRELFLYTLQNVTGSLQSSLADISCVQIEPQPDGSNTLYTLGVRPIQDLDILRQTAVTTTDRRQMCISARPPTSSGQSLIEFTDITTTRHTAWQLNATISLPDTYESLSRLRSVGFFIRASPARHETRTQVSFHIHEEIIQVHREFSIPAKLRTATDGTGTFNLHSEQGPFTLFSFAQPSTKEDNKDGQLSGEPGTDGNATATVNGNTITQPLVQEKLQLSIICDGDVLEVFANDRFALATMLYTGDPLSNGVISCFAEFQVGPEEVQLDRENMHESVMFDHITVWDGLGRGERYVGCESDSESGSESRSKKKSEDETFGS